MSSVVVALSKTKEKKKIKRARPEPQYFINPNNNLAKFPTNDSKNASIFYGVSVPWDSFYIYLLRTDEAFAEDVLEKVRDDDPDFAEYEIQDIIDDCLEEWYLENFKRTTPSKAKESQCACFMSDIMFHLLRVATVNCEDYFKMCSIGTMHPDPSIPVTIFPGLDIEYVSSEAAYTDDKDMIYIGKRVFVYRDGKPCTDLPDIISQVDTELNELAASLDANSRMKENHIVRFL